MKEYIKSGTYLHPSTRDERRLKEKESDFWSKGITVLRTRKGTNELERLFGTYVESIE